LGSLAVGRAALDEARRRLPIADQQQRPRAARERALPTLMRFTPIAEISR
jgi:hypothetical protein